MEYALLFVDATTTTAAAVTRLEPLIERFGALPVAPYGTPIVQNGEYEIRVLFPTDLTLRLIRLALTEHGRMVVTREETYQ